MALGAWIISSRSRREMAKGRFVRAILPDAGGHENVRVRAAPFVAADRPPLSGAQQEWRI